MSLSYCLSFITIMPCAGRKEAESTVDFRQEIVILCERLFPAGIDMIIRYFAYAFLYLIRPRTSLSAQDDIVRNDSEVWMIKGYE